MRLLRLNARCPRCGRPPLIRTVPETVEVMNDRNPEQLVLTYRCHVRDCGEVYEIRAKDFTEAA